MVAGLDNYSGDLHQHGQLDFGQLGSNGGRETTSLNQEFPSEIRGNPPAEWSGQSWTVSFRTCPRCSSSPCPLFCPSTPSSRTGCSVEVAPAGYTGNGRWVKTIQTAALPTERTISPLGRCLLWQWEEGKGPCWDGLCPGDTLPSQGVICQCTSHYPQSRWAFCLLTLYLKKAAPFF